MSHLTLVLEGTKEKRGTSTLRARPSAAGTQGNPLIWREQPRPPRPGQSWPLILESQGSALFAEEILYLFT